MFLVFLVTKVYDASKPYYKYWASLIQSILSQIKKSSKILDVHEHSHGYSYNISITIVLQFVTSETAAVLT